VTKKVSSLPMHPDLWCFLIQWVGDQVECVTRLHVLQMAIPIGEGDPMDRGTKVRRPAIREGGTGLAHSGLNVPITVHRPRVIR